MNSIFLLSTFHIFLLYPIIFVFFFIPPCNNEHIIIFREITSMMWFGMLFLLVDQSISISVKSLVLYYSDRAPKPSMKIYSMTMVPKVAPVNEKEVSSEPVNAKGYENIEKEEKAEENAKNDIEESSEINGSSVGSTSSTLERCEE